MKKEDFLIISEKLRTFAKVKFGTLENFAKAIHMSPQQLQQYLRGKRIPGAAILNNMRLAGCNINLLLGATEKEFEHYLLIEKLSEEIKEDFPIDKLKSFIELISVLRASQKK